VTTTSNGRSGIETSKKVSDNDIEWQVGDRDVQLCCFDISLSLARARLDAACRLGGHRGWDAERHAARVDLVRRRFLERHV